MTFDLNRAKKLGYVIASEQEDYLARFKKSSAGIFKGWSPTPEQAIVYDTYLKASKVLKQLVVSYRVWILELWETDKQLIVASSSEDKPHWL